MTRERFEASVQYNDFKGTVAADRHDNRSIRTLLVEKKLIDPEKEFIIGIRLWVGETHGAKPPPPTVEALVVPLPEGSTNLEQWLNEKDDPIPVKMIELKLTLEEFFALFKRFEVVLTPQGLGLEGREYEYSDE